MVGVAAFSGRLRGLELVRQSGVLSSRAVVELRRDARAGSLYPLKRTFDRVLSRSPFEDDENGH